MASDNLIIVDVVAEDIRFPTSLTNDGSDAVHKDPNYSCAYVILKTSNGQQLEGHGFTFTIGRGTEVVVKAIESLSFLVKGKKFKQIIEHFGDFCKSLSNESQLRWLGPEKGVIHLATAAIVNAIWDLWAKIENKPVWKLLVDLEPQQIINLVDFRYLSDVLTKDEALVILQKNRPTIAERETFIRQHGIPAYITSVGWMGYSDEKIKKLCETALQEGWTSFKMKVGCNLEDDCKRAALIRKIIGDDKNLMMDANQVWDVDEAIRWMNDLAKYKPLWIEEPTSPDDVLGHQKISTAVRKLGFGVATGEHCQNRILFKQFLQSNAMQFCQIDACRMGGVNEVIAVLLLAAKFKVPVCPHAGGVGLCELVPHLAAFNYVCVSPSFDNVMVEFADHLHEHFVNPAVIKSARYVTPTAPGYSSQLKSDSHDSYRYPDGPVWQTLIKHGKV
jgi:L-fuconate dehydratase